METQVILFLLGHGQHEEDCSAEDTMANGFTETDVDIYFARTIIKEASDDVSSILSELSDYSLWSGLTNKCWNLSIKFCPICDHKHHLMIPLEAHQYTQIEEKLKKVTGNSHKLAPFKSWWINKRFALNTFSSPR